MDEEKKREVLELLCGVVHEDGLSPELSAYFMGVSHTSVYRWLGSERAYFITNDNIDRILKFLMMVSEIKESWKELATEYDRFDRVHLAVKRHYLNPKCVVILKDEDLTLDEKASALTEKTLKAWRKGKKRK